MSMTDKEGATLQAEYEASQFTLCPLPLDFTAQTCYTQLMTHTATRQQLIDALTAEYEYLCHDDFDPDVDPSPAEYRAMLESLSNDELLDETSVDDEYNLNEFINTWL